jgi:TolB-like protein
MKAPIRTTDMVMMSLLWIAILSSCANPSKAGETASPSSPTAQFPRMIVGDSWVTRGFHPTSGLETYHLKVIQVLEDGGFLIESREDNGTIHHYTFNNRYEWIDIVKMPEGQKLKVLPRPPMNRFNFPIFIGKKWKDEFVSWNPRLKKDSRFVNEYAVEAYEPVKTTAGTFMAFKIVRRSTIPETKWKGTEIYWYAPEAKREVKSAPDYREGSELIAYQLAAVQTKPEVERPKVVVKGEKIKIAVIEFQSLNEDAKKDNLGKIVSEVLTTSLVNSESFKIIEREQLQKVTREFELSQTGIIDTSSAKQIGKVLGADAIVTGSVIKIGKNLRLDARIIDVTTGIILTAEKTEGETDLNSIGKMADRLVADLVTKFYTDRK